VKWKIREQFNGKVVVGTCRGPNGKIRRKQQELGGKRSRLNYCMGRATIPQNHARPLGKKGGRQLARNVRIGVNTRTASERSKERVKKR